MSCGMEKQRIKRPLYGQVPWVGEGVIEGEWKRMEAAQVGWRWGVKGEVEQGEGVEP